MDRNDLIFDERRRLPRCVACGVPVAPADGLLSPTALVARICTVYAVPSVKPVIVCLYRRPVSVDEAVTRLVAGSAAAWRDESYSWEPDFHWTVKPVVLA